MTAKADELYFRGPPSAVEAVVRTAFEDELFAGKISARVKVKLNPTADSTDLALRTQPLGGGTRLRLTLPAYTPPNRYSAQVLVGTRELPATIEVETLRDLAVSPGRFYFVAKAGGDDQLRLTILNRGNVDWPVPPACGFGLFEVGGVESALSAVYRSPHLKGQERINQLAEELARRNALVRGAIQGSGVVRPGSLLELGVKLRWPDDVEPGKVYSGVWMLPLSNLRVQVSIEVAAKDSGESRTK